MVYKQNLHKIKAFVFDVDGVLTDGSVYLLPDGAMCRTMNVLDGLAIVKALRHGYKIGVITGGNDPMVKNRLNYLGITDYYHKSLYKLNDFEDFKSKYNLDDGEILTMGDDLPDIPLLEKSLIGACPANAVAEVKAVADYISQINGGNGAARDVIEQVMKSQGKWFPEDGDRNI